MSELTQCNYCSLENMKHRYKGQKLHIIGNRGWLDIYFVPKGEKLDTHQDPKTGNHLSKQWKSSMVEISTNCCC